MSSRYAHVSLLAVLCLLFSGCSSSVSAGGGGGGGGNNNPTAVTFNFSGAAPAAVATAIGSGTFAAATVSSKAVTISVPVGTKSFAVAWVCQETGEGVSVTIQNVIEATTTDGTSYDLTCSAPSSTGTSGTLTLSMDASAFSDPSAYPEFVQIVVENETYLSLGLPSGLVVDDYSLTAPAGSDRVDISVNGFNSLEGTSSAYMLAAKSFSGVAVPGSLNNGDTVTFTAADATLEEPITYKNVPAGYGAPGAFAWVQPAGDQYPFTLTEDGATAYPALPATIAQSADVYHLSAESTGLTGVATGQFVSEIEKFSGEGPATVTFPTPGHMSGPTPAALPTVDFSYSGFAGQTGVSDILSIQWTASASTPLGPETTDFYYTMTASADYLSGATSLQLPDLSSITGFIPDPASGTELIWSAQTSQNSAGSWPSSAVNSNEFSVGASGEYLVP
jgi:hypothetical protein